MLLKYTEVKVKAEVRVEVEKAEAEVEEDTTKCSNYTPRNEFYYFLGIVHSIGELNITKETVTLPFFLHSYILDYCDSLPVYFQYLCEKKGAVICFSNCSPVEKHFIVWNEPHPLFLHTAWMNKDSFVCYLIGILCTLTNSVTEHEDIFYLNIRSKKLADNIHFLCIYYGITYFKDENHRLFIQI